MKLTTLARSVTTGAVLLASTLRADIVIDLQNGVITETFGSTTPSPTASAGPNFVSNGGYANVRIDKKGTGCPASMPQYEAKVEVNLAPANVGPVQKMSVLVEYEGKPTGWTTHLGDDTNNNGFGGGTSLDGVSELQVLEQNLAVYSKGLGVGEVDKILGSQLRLTEGALHFNVSDQVLTIGQPYTRLESPNQKHLFDFSQGDKRIYAAFNRVIQDGSSRKGCGAKKVHIVFE
ncbi:MAG: hypothetical protein U0Q16_24375 [Bryobacteraceae bacterium]